MKKPSAEETMSAPEKFSLNRRSFLKTSAFAAAGLTFTRLPIMAGPFTREDFDKLVPADKKLSPEWVKSLTARGERTVYRGAELKTIGMPIGGIACGQLYLGGDGKLWHWDIFNQHIGTGDGHYSKPPEPSSPLEQGFALRVTHGGKTQVRPLDRTGCADDGKHQRQTRIHMNLQTTKKIMTKHLVPLAIATTLLITSCTNPATHAQSVGPGGPATVGAEALESVFQHPPDAARPGVLWMWMGCNLSQAGITRDLEALKAAGFGRTTMFSLADTCTPWAGEIRNSPTPEIISWTEPWWAMVRHAAQESKRLGLDFGMFNGPSYESSGGKWITPELSMQQICWSAINVAGGAEISVTLARPTVDPRAVQPFPVFNPETGKVEKPEISARKTYYREVAVLALPAAGGVAREQVIDLTTRVDAEGKLVWNAPPGDWTIYRFGHTTMGTLIQPAQWQATGFECDKMSAQAVTFHMNHVIGEIQKHLGDLIGTGFTHVHFDSYEAGTPTWTPKMREEFSARRGYDATPFLTTFANRTIGSEAETKKFKGDFDETIKDLYRDVYYTTVSKMLREAKLTFLCEPYGGPWRQDEIMPLVQSVMTEFWTGGGKFGPYELEPTVAALRKSGQNIVEAEAFTGAPSDSRWSETPAWLKPIGDAAFCAGVNRLVLHRFVEQPWDDRYQPGNAMGQWGTHFDRTQTWWQPGMAMVKYWQRCQALLQWGKIATNNFAVVSSDGGAQLQSIHRSDGVSDVYFVANIARTNGTARGAFDAAGRQPELWNPVTGEMRDLPEFEIKDGKTIVPLEFAPTESCFIVFRKTIAPQSRLAGVPKNFPELKTAGEISGAWQVTFDPKWGGPAKPVEFATLEDWTKRPEPGIKYFSGTAVYRKTFDAPEPASGDRPPAIFLSLGVVQHLARVQLNGRDLGVVWCAPWRVAVPRGLLKAKGNTLEIKITNVWANRLIGDEQEPADCEWGQGHMGNGGPLKEFPEWFVKGQPRPSKGRFTFTTWNYFTKDSPLVPSGLLGPVTLSAQF